MSETPDEAPSWQALLDTAESLRSQFLDATQHSMHRQSKQASVPQTAFAGSFEDNTPATAAASTAGPVPHALQKEPADAQDRLEGHRLEDLNTAENPCDSPPVSSHQLQDMRSPQQAQTSAEVWQHSSSGTQIPSHRLQDVSLNETTQRLSAAGPHGGTSQVSSHRLQDVSNTDTPNVEATSSHVAPPCAETSQLPSYKLEDVSMADHASGPSHTAPHEATGSLLDESGRLLSTSSQERISFLRDLSMSYSSVYGEREFHSGGMRGSGHSVPSLQSPVPSLDSTAF